MMKTICQRKELLKQQEYQQLSVRHTENVVYDTEKSNRQKYQAHAKD